jgi:hypothetical protein
MEDLAGGLATLRAMPYALQKIEAAYLKGGDAMDLLLEGKAPGTQAEMVQFIEKWGGIISAVAFGVLRKQAKIQADENAVALLTQLIDLANTVLGGKEQSEGSEE